MLRISMNTSILETKAAPESEIYIAENEVEDVLERIKEAQYFDASSMAPLTPSALVSLSYVEMMGHT